MLAKVFIVGVLLTIAFTLGSSFYFLIRDKGEGTRTVRRLSWRVAISVLLFMMILLAMASGWLQPGSTGPIRYPAIEQTDAGDP